MHWNRSFCITFILLLFLASEPVIADESEQVEVKLIAQMYLASMDYIFEQQNTINTSNVDKSHLFGKQFIENVSTVYKEKYKRLFPQPSSLKVSLMYQVMIEVMEDNKTLIQDNDLTFKGFIPAVYAFQISQKFIQKGVGIKLKFTNQANRVRNLFNLPEAWEANSINRLKQTNESELIISSNPSKNSQPDRYITKISMSPMCLTCHGAPQDNPVNNGKPVNEWTRLDKTGFEMENWKITDFGGAVSASFYELK